MGAFTPGRRATERPQTRTAQFCPRVPTWDIETDGGHVDGDATFAMYIDDEHGYSLAYPTGWTVERDADGATFEAPRSTAGVIVFVEGSELTPEASATTFLADLVADEHVHALELVAQRDTWLKSGQTGRVIECAYSDDSCDRWRLAYLFVRAADTTYTVGVDWSDATDFETVAARIVASFVVDAG